MCVVASIGRSHLEICSESLGEITPATLEGQTALRWTFRL